MRALAAALLVLATALPALAGEPSVVLVDWREGAFAAGARVGVEGVNAATFPLAVDACHRQVLVDLLYAPGETALALDGVGEVALLHTFRVDVLSGDAVVASRVVQQPGYGHALGRVPPGDHAVRIVLTQGAGVEWSLRVRGWEVPGEPACLPDVVLAEVEANPPGPDAGAEWVELWNRDDAPVDLWGWTLVSGDSEVVLPEGTLVPAGGRLVVTLPDAMLEDAGAAVELRLLSAVRDATPTLADEADDERTWQRGEAWSFEAGTPGA